MKTLSSTTKIGAAVCLIAILASQQASAQVNNMQQVVGISYGDSLNVRSGPGRNFRDIGDIRNNGAVSVLGYDSSGRWARVRWRSQTGWVYAKYLTGGVGGRNLTNGASSNQVYNGPAKLGPHIVKGAHAADSRGMPVHSAPDRNSKVNQFIGDNVDVFVESLSRNGRWAFIRFSNGTGHVRAKFLKSTGSRPQTGGNNQNGQANYQVSAPDGLPLPAVFTVTNVNRNDQLYVRIQPRATAQLITSYAPNSSVNVVGFMSNGWARINVGNKIGYVNAKFLTRRGGVLTSNGMQLGLKCDGTRPAWILNIRQDQTVRFRDRRNRAEPTAAISMITPSSITNSYPYNFNAAPYSATLEQQVCNDGRTGSNYGWRITLIKPKASGGWQTLNGCCKMR